MPADDGSFGSGLLAAADASVAETYGALYLGAAQLKPGFADVAGELVTELSGEQTPESLGLLLALHAVAPSGGALRRDAGAQAARLAAAGVPRPRWADELEQPVTPGEYYLIPAPDGRMALLSGTFRRAQAAHFVAVLVDTELGGAAWLVDTGRCPAVPAARPAGAPRRQPRSPAEFRAQVEHALRIRDSYAEMGFDDDLDYAQRVEYAAQALLTRARLACLD